MELVSLPWVSGAHGKPVRTRLHDDMATRRVAYIALATTRSRNSNIFTSKYTSVLPERRPPGMMRYVMLVGHEIILLKAGAVTGASDLGRRDHS